MAITGTLQQNQTTAKSQQICSDFATINRLPICRNNEQTPLSSGLIEDGQVVVGACER
jgi:hypothetical protein